MSKWSERTSDICRQIRSRIAAEVPTKEHDFKKTNRANFVDSRVQLGPRLRRMVLERATGQSGADRAGQLVANKLGS